jgi:hypothetical protein
MARLDGVTTGTTGIYTPVIWDWWSTCSAGPPRLLGDRRAAHGAGDPAARRAHPRGRDAAALTVRRRVRCLLQAHVATDSRALLGHATQSAWGWRPSSLLLGCFPRSPQGAALELGLQLIGGGPPYVDDSARSLRPMGPTLDQAIEGPKPSSPPNYTRCGAWGRETTTSYGLMGSGPRSTRSCEPLTCPSRPRHHRYSAGSV